LSGRRLIGQQFYETEIGPNGKPVVKKGVVQTVPDPRYFQTRPSSTSDNAASTAFSNLGPNGKTTLTAFQGYIQTYLRAQHGNEQQALRRRRDQGLGKSQSMPSATQRRPSTRTSPLPTRRSRRTGSPPSAIFRCAG